MAEYKNSIKLGVLLPQQNDVQGQLNTLIKNLNDTKINLDINIANSDVAKQLEVLTNLANNFKNSLGGNINLGNVNEIINQTTTSMERLNSEVLKTRTVLNQDGTGNRYSDIANGIGIITKQTEVLNQETKQWELTEQSKTTTIVNNGKIRKTLEDITNAQERLNNLQSRGNVNNDNIDLLKNNLTGAYNNIKGNNNIYNSNEIQNYLAQVKQLELVEKDNIQLANQIQDAWDKAYQQRVSAERTAIEQIEANEKKAYENEIKMLGEQALAKQKAEQDLVNAMANGREKSQLKSQQIDRSQELSQNKAINQALEEQRQILIQQEQAYKQIDVLKQNGIISNSDISKLEKMVQEVNSLKDMKNAMNSIMSTSMMNESSIVSITKQINDLQLKLTKMKQTFGEKLPSGFIEATELELNKLKENLKNVDGMNFNGIKNNLNSVKSSMEQVSNETKQMINATKESGTGGFFTSMSDFLSKTGLFYGTVQGVQMLVSAVKEGVEWNKYLNDSFTDMAITMNISEQSFNNMSNTIDEMGKKIGVNAQDLHDIARVYANATTDVDTILSKIKPEAMLSNVSGIKGENITKTIQATSYAFDLLNESESNAGQVTENIGNILTKVSQNMRYDFQGGIVALNDAIRTSGSVAKESGMSLEQYSAYMGALIERTGKTGSELGTFWKMLTARVQQIKAVGDEVGISREDMGNAEKALTSIGVSVRGQNGSLRDMDSILQDVNSKWSSLSDQERSQVAEGVAGNRHRATFLSLMRSMTTEQNLYNDALNSSGALQEANEKRAESFQGKLNTLKTTFNQLSATMINSKVLSGGIDIATGTLGGINTFVSKLGTIPTVITTVVGALTILNSKFRENVNLMSGSIIPGYTQFTNYLSNLRNKLSDSAVQQEKTIAVSREFMSASQQAGMSTRGMATELVGMEAKLLATRAGMVACTIATVALQTALSMGVSLIASMAIGGLMNLANSSENAKQKIEELSSSIKEEGNSISQSEELLSKKTDLENQISQTSEGTKQNTDLKKQLLDIERQISDVLPQSTSGFDSEGKAISANTDLIRAQIQAKKDKLAVDAQELISNAKDVDGLMKKIELTEKQLDAVKLAQLQGKKSVAIPVSLDSDATQNIGIDQKYIADAEKSLTEYKSTISNVRLAILQLKEAGKSDDEIKSMFPNIDLSAINNFTNGIENNTTKTKENSSAKASNAKNTKILADATRELQQSTDGKISSDTLEKLNKEYPDLGINAENAKDKVEELNKTVSSGDDNAVQKATQAYSDATQSIAQAEQYLQKLNKAQEITPTLAKQMSKTYGDDVLTSLQNVSDAQDFLNSKIEESKEIQEENYETLIGDDQNFYQQKIANNEDFQNAYTQFLNSFNADGEEAYQVDYGNYQSLNELKQGTMSDFGIAVNQWLSQYVGTNADGYAVDLSNFTSIAQAKEEILKRLNEEIKKINSNLAGAEAMQQELANWVNNEQDGYSDSFDVSMNKHLNNDIDTFKSKVGDLNGAIQEVDANFSGIGAQMKGFGGTTDFGGGSGGAGSGGSGSKGKSGGGSGSGKSQEEKDAEKAQKEADDWKKKIDDLNSDTIKPDPYYEVNNTITQLDNSMKALKTSEDGLTGNDLVEAKQKEIDVMNQQINAQKSLQALQEIERDNLKSTLSQYGILTDETGNLTNAQEKLNQMQAEANAISGSSEVEYEVKKKAIDQVKQLSDQVSKYNDLVNKTLPETIDKWNELSNSIKKANEEAKKASEDTINATGEKLVEALKQEYEKKKTAELKSLKDEYDDDVKDLQDEIDKLQKKLDGLNDESTDNQTKLAKLKAERQLWLNETNNVFAKSKVTALDSQISDLEKTIQKDSLQKQIDDLNKQKSTREDSYNKQVQDTEDLYSDLEDEHKLYNKATELLTTKNTKRIKELLNSQDESFKEIGTKLGEALNDPIQQEVNDTITAIDNLIDKINELNEAKGEKSSSKSSSSKSSKEDKTESSSNSDKTKTYSNGDYEDSKGYYHHVATYDTGGRTPSNIDDGAIGVLHSDEKILNKDDTVMIDEIYDYIKSSGSLITQMSNPYSNNASYTIPNLSTNLSSIDNNLINNNTDNSNYSPVQMAVNIVNHNGAEAVMNEKTLEKMVNKVVQKSATKFGGKGFTNR